MSVLCDTDILAAIKDGFFKIEPFAPTQIQPASIDLTLHRKAERLTLETIDLQAGKLSKDDLERGIEHIDLDGGYTLKAGEYILGYTHELLTVSSFLNAKVFNRNSLVRCGLNVAAGCYINPGFHGRMPLVIHNFGKADIILWPEIDICQLELHNLSNKAFRGYEERHEQDNIVEAAFRADIIHTQENQQNVRSPFSRLLDQRIKAMAERGV